MRNDIKVQLATDYGIMDTMSVSNKIYILPIDKKTTTTYFQFISPELLVLLTDLIEYHSCFFYLTNRYHGNILKLHNSIILYAAQLCIFIPDFNCETMHIYFDHNFFTPWQEVL